MWNPGATQASGTQFCSGLEQHQYFIPAVCGKLELCPWQFLLLKLCGIWRCSFIENKCNSCNARALKLTCLCPHSRRKPVSICRVKLPALLCVVKRDVLQCRPFLNFKCVFSSGGKNLFHVSRTVWPAWYVGEGYYKYFLPLQRNQTIKKNQLKGHLLILLG